MKDLQRDIAVLEGARLAIFHTEKDINIQKLMSGYGFTSKHMHHGKSLLAKVLLLEAMHMDDDKEPGINPQQRHADIIATLAIFKDHVNVARSVFVDEPEILHELNVNRIATQKQQWMQQALHFYYYLEAYPVLLEPLGLERAVIAQTLASVQALMAMKTVSVRKKAVKKSISNKGTANEEKIFKALEMWVLEFQSVARVAFKNNPPMLEIFGVSVLSRV